MKRIVTGIVLAAAVVYLVLWGPLYLLVTVQVLFTLIGFWEYLRLAKSIVPARVDWPFTMAPLGLLDRLLEAGGSRATVAVGYTATVAAALSSLADAQTIRWIALLALFAMLWLTLGLYRGKRLTHFYSSSPTIMLLLGVSYIAAPLALLVWTWRQEDGPFQILFALFVIWAGDTAGYFVGKNLGKHKSSPHISPNKTWEGTIASFIAALLVATVAGLWFAGTDSWWEWLPLAAMLNVAGQVGDLAESGLKRSAGMKDSSNLIPGHGGVLDRIDALLFAAPVLWYYWFWNGA